MSDAPNGETPWSKADATHYHARSELPDKGRTIKGLVVGNSWDLEPLAKRSSPGDNRPLRYDSCSVFRNDPLSVCKKMFGKTFLLGCCLRLSIPNDHFKLDLFGLLIC